MNQKKGKNKNGFTLVEVLVAATIVTIMVFIYQIVINNISINRAVKNKEVASRIASTEIEVLRALPFDSLPASGSFSDPLLSSLPNGQGNLIVNDFNTKTKKIDVIVSWIESDNTNKTLEFTTLITQTGL